MVKSGEVCREVGRCVESNKDESLLKDENDRAFIVMESLLSGGAPSGAAYGVLVTFRSPPRLWRNRHHHRPPSSSLHATPLYAFQSRRSEALALEYEGMQEGLLCLLTHVCSVF